MLLRKFLEDPVVEVAADKRTVCLDDDAVVLAVFYDRALLAVWVDLQEDWRQLQFVCSRAGNAYLNLVYDGHLKAGSTNFFDMLNIASYTLKMIEQTFESVENVLITDSNTPDLPAVPLLDECAPRIETVQLPGDRRMNEVEIDVVFVRRIGELPVQRSLREMGTNRGQTSRMTRPHSAVCSHNQSQDGRFSTLQHRSAGWHDGKSASARTDE